jgi:hypothetical protein
MTDGISVRAILSSLNAVALRRFSYRPQQLEHDLNYISDMLVPPRMLTRLSEG